MSRFFRPRVGLAVPCWAQATLVLALALPSISQTPGPSLDDLRRSGTIGERFDGFVEIRDRAASDEVRGRVREVNDKRREIYQKRARDENVPVDQVGRVYAKQIFDEARSGTWFLDEGGGWKQKP